MDHLIAKAEWKAVADSSGEVDGYGVFYGNVDLGDDVAVPGCSKKTLAERQRFPLIADHELKTTGVVGSVRNAYEDGRGVRVRASFADTQKAQDLRKLCVGGHVGGMSITYEPVKFHFGQKSGRQVRFLDEIKIHEFTITPFPMNPEARILVAKATISTSDRNNLPDSDFAYIEPGGTKDASGKTEPRSLRHFPIHDEAHVRAALSRIGQGAEFSAQAKPKVMAAARKFGIDVTQSSSIDFSQFADSMRAALAIPMETASKAAADLLIASYYLSDFAAGQEPTADAADPVVTASKSLDDYSAQFLVHPPEPRDGALDPVAPLENARVNADLDRLQAQIEHKLGKV